MFFFLYVSRILALFFATPVKIQKKKKPMTTFDVLDSCVLLTVKCVHSSTCECGFVQQKLLLWTRSRWKGGGHQTKDKKREKKKHPRNVGLILRKMDRRSLPSVVPLLFSRRPADNLPRQQQPAHNCCSWFVDLCTIKKNISKKE